MTDKTNPEQVRIQIWDRKADEWITPYQTHAALAAFRAIGADITDYSGTYRDADLRAFREELRKLDAVITQRIGSDKHEHRHSGQALTHSHPGGGQPHGYFGHPEDIPPADVTRDEYGLFGPDDRT